MCFCVHLNLFHAENMIISVMVFTICYLTKFHIHNAHKSCLKICILLKRFSDNTYVRVCVPARALVNAVRCFVSRCECKCHVHNAEIANRYKYLNRDNVYRKPDFDVDVSCLEKHVS